MDATEAGNDLITSLRSDLAGLQYKRDKLISEVSYSFPYTQHVDTFPSNLSALGYYRIAT